MKKRKKTYHSFSKLPRKYIYIWPFFIWEVCLARDIGSLAIIRPSTITDIISPNDCAQHADTINY